MPQTLNASIEYVKRLQPSDIHLDSRLRGSGPPKEAQRLLIHPKLTPEVEHLAQGDFNMITIDEAICICHLRALVNSHLI